MEALSFSPEMMSGAIDWINGCPSSLDEATVKSYISTLTRGFNHRFSILHPLDPQPRHMPLGMKVPSLTALLGEEAAELVRRKPEPVNVEPQAQTVPQRGLDSVELINSISHMASLAGSAMTSSRAQIILYCIYGSYLAHNGVRLDIEHPQVWKYGPVFPRAYKKGCLTDRGACQDSYSRLSEENPDVATLVSSKTSSMLFTPMVDLDACHKSALSPYGKTLKENPQKWGTQIDDNLIADFFGSRRESRAI